MAQSNTVKSINKNKILLVIFAALFAGIGIYVLTRSSASTGYGDDWVSGAFGYNCRTYSPPTLKVGSKGECVKVVQKGLNNWIAAYNWLSGKVLIQPLTIDGQYGNATASVVKTYQSRNGLTADGVVGYNTWSRFGTDCFFFASCSQQDKG